jgi:hypothetical protein
MSHVTVARACLFPLPRPPLSQDGRGHRHSSSSDRGTAGRRGDRGSVDRRRAAVAFASPCAGPEIDNLEQVLRGSVELWRGRKRGSRITIREGNHIEDDAVAIGTYVAECEKGGVRTQVCLRSVLNPRAGGRELQREYPQEVSFHCVLAAMRVTRRQVWRMSTPVLTAVLSVHVCQQKRMPHLQLPTPVSTRSFREV